MTRPQDPSRSRLTSELGSVRSELTRIDNKCATLVSLSGAGLAFLVTQVGTASAGLLVRGLLAAAGLALTAAAVLLLRCVLRPRLGAVGFCRYATMTSDDIRRELAVGTGIPGRQEATELAVMARLTTAKYRRVQQAVDLLTAGLVVLGLALVVGVLA